MSTADELELKGFDYLRDRQWSKARECFQEMLSLPLDPLRQVKVLKNIMGTYKQEGNNPEAIAIAKEALEIIEANDLYANTTEGPELRGTFRGYLSLLEGKPVIPSFTEYTIAGPIEQHFSLYDQLRAFFSTAIIGSAIGAAIGSQLHVNLEVSFIKGAAEVLSVAGAILGWFVSNIILEYTSKMIHSWTGKDKKSSVAASINLLTVVALIYAIVMPFLIPDVIIDSILTIFCLFALLLATSKIIYANFRIFSIFLLSIVFILSVYWVVAHSSLWGTQSLTSYKSLPLWMFLVFLSISLSIARGMALAMEKKNGTFALFLVIVMGSVIWGLYHFNYHLKLSELFILPFGFLLAYLYQMYYGFQQRSLIVSSNPNDSNDQPS